MYIIAGVSGRTGAVVADALLRANKPVRVLVRRAAQGAPWRARGAEVAEVRLDDVPTLTRALAGATGAYLLSPQDPRAADPISDSWRLADAMARAIADSGVAHVVVLSSMGAHLADDTGIVRTMHALEERLAGSPAALTFVRAAFHLDNWVPFLGATAGGKLPTFVPPDRSLPMVATRDAGTLAARALIEGPVARRDVVELAGPRDYSPRDLADLLTTLLSRPVAPELIPLEAMVPTLVGFGASVAFAEQVRQRHQGIARDGIIGQKSGGVRTLRGSIDAETFFAPLLAPRSAS